MKLLNFLFTFMFLFFLGCASISFFHGPSIKLNLDIHSNVIADDECLSCHDQNNSEIPALKHPGFKGCIKCHNDNI